VSPFQLHALTAFLLVTIGLHALIVRENLLRKIMALNVIGAGIFLLLVSLAYGDGSGPPDPVPQALVLTGIVIAISLTAFALALLRRYHEVSGRARLQEEEGLE
jgi:multicomponent Na+:H+ antiporter subunit C